MHGEKLAWYRRGIEDLTREFGVNLESGLSEHAAMSALSRVGPNVLSGGKAETLLDRIVRQIKNPLAFLLLLAGIATTLLAEYVDSTVIFIALVINIAISLYQEGRADRAFERLRASQEKTAVVLRGGVKRMIKAEDLALGDLVILDTGMNIPADLRIVRSHDLEINESPLTGEWIDVSKHVDPIATVVPLAEQKNMAFMGTLVTGGGGRGVVVAIGNETQIGAIATALATGGRVATPLEESVRGIARLLSWVILVLLIGIFAVGLLQGGSFTELLLISIAIAVAAIPEGLPAAVTVILAIGMEAILSRGGLVRSLLAAETLGSTTVIITDKTGTLTKAEMRVARVVTFGSLQLEEEKKGEHLAHEAHGDERDALEFAALASDAFIETSPGKSDPLHEERTVRGKPVERAVVLAALDSGLDQTELLKNYPRVGFLPFESKYLLAISLNDIRGLKHNRLHITGAPELLLARAGGVYLEGRSHVKSKELSERFERVLKRYASEGARVIGVGIRETSKTSLTKDDAADRAALVDGLIFVGFIILHDPLREDAESAIRTARGAGARVIMATGDNPETAKAVARECGIWKEGDRVHTGADVAAATDEALVKLAGRASVFARMLPEHKMRLARVLQAEGEVVAMTGDGVNDAPALQTASIGVALGSGTEVAKEASDLVLLNNSFTVIVSAIEEGRRIIDNLRKVIAYLLSTSFTEIIVVGGALVAGLPLPLLPAQILWTNMLSEGFMNFAFAFEPKEGDLMRRDPRTSGARELISRRFIAFIAVVGFASGFLLLGLYGFLIGNYGITPEVARSVIFAALTVGTIFIAFSLKDLRTGLWRIVPWSNRYLLASLLVAFAGLTCAFLWEPLREMLRLEPIDIGMAAPFLFGIVVLELIVVEIAKLVFFERRPLSVVA